MALKKKKRKAKPKYQTGGMLPLLQAQGAGQLGQAAPAQLSGLQGLAGGQGAMGALSGAGGAPWGQIAQTATNIATPFIEEKEHKNIAQRTGQGAALGATVGSVIPGVGTAIGAGAGAAIGAGVGFVERKKFEKERELQSAQGALAMGAEAYRNAQRPMLELGGMKLVRYQGPEHEQGGIALSNAEVEGGETEVGNYVFSDTLARRDGNKTFAQLSRDIDNRYNNPNDIFAQNSRRQAFESLVAEQEGVREDILRCGGKKIPKYYLGGKKMKRGGFKPGTYQMGGFKGSDPINLFMAAANTKPKMRLGGTPGDPTIDPTFLLDEGLIRQAKAGIPLQEIIQSQSRYPVGTSPALFNQPSGQTTPMLDTAPVSQPLIGRPLLPVPGVSPAQFTRAPDAQTRSIEDDPVSQPLAVNPRLPVEGVSPERFNRDDVRTTPALDSPPVSQPLGVRPRLPVTGISPAQFNLDVGRTTPALDSPPVSQPLAVNPRLPVEGISPVQFNQGEAQTNVSLETPYVPDPLVVDPRLPVSGVNPGQFTQTEGTPSLDTPPVSDPLAVNPRFPIEGVNPGGFVQNPNLGSPIADNVDIPGLPPIFRSLPGESQRLNPVQPLPWLGEGFRTQTRSGLDPITGARVPAGYKGLVNIQGFDAQNRFNQYGVPFTMTNLNAFEEWAEGKGYLPKFKRDQRWGPEHDRVFQEFATEFKGSPEYRRANVDPVVPGGARTLTPPVGGTVPPTDDQPKKDIERKDTETTDEIAQGNIPSSTYRGPNTLLSALPNLAGAGINAYLADQVAYDRTMPFTVDPQLMDPTRALQNVGTAFSGVDESIAQNTRGGQFLTNRIAAAASEAGQRAQVATDYEARNKGIISQADVFNAQQRASANRQNAAIQQQELQDKLGLQGQAGQALVQSGQDALNQLNLNAQTRFAIPFSGTQNYITTVDDDDNIIQVARASRGGQTYTTPSVAAARRRKLRDLFQPVRADQ